MHVGTVFSCQKYSYTSKSKRGLKSHVKSHHKGKIYPFPECDQVFAYVGDMNLHKRSRHEGVVYFCKYCSHTENHKQYAFNLSYEEKMQSFSQLIFQKNCSSFYLFLRPNFEGGKGSYCLRAIFCIYFNSN